MVEKEYYRYGKLNVLLNKIQIFTKFNMTLLLHQNNFLKGTGEVEQDWGIQCGPR